MGNNLVHCIFTFTQPPIAVRVLLDGALLAGVWVAGRKGVV